MDFVEIEYRERESDWGMSDLQSHDYYELYFLIDGRRNLFIGERMFSVEARAFCVIPPFAMHKTSGGSYKRININVSPRLLSEREAELLDTLARGGAYSLDGEWADGVMRMLREASNIDLVDTEEKQRISLAFTRAIVYTLSKERLSKLGPCAASQVKPHDEQMLEVAAYLNEHYREELTLADISERFYISKNSLSERFRRAMNCSVMQYLAFLRLSRAKELLTTTTRSMGEISEACGYSSLNYFSLIFKKSVGLSPREYRKSR